jgi:rRNA biogenesis protein RRP5
LHLIHARCVEKRLFSFFSKDIDVVNKFAQLEFKYGDLERAKTMYDSLLFTYSNRTDLWSVYVDMLVKYKKFDDARYFGQKPFDI